MPPESAVRTAALLRHNALLLARDPGPIAGRLIMPLVFMTLLHPLYRAAQGPDAGTEQAVVGALVTFSLLALNISGGAIFGERAARTWDRLRASPLRTGELLAGKALPVLGVLLAQQAIVMGFGRVVFGLAVPEPLLPAAVLLCWSCTLLGLGALLGVVVRSLGELSAAYDIGGLLFGSLGGALVPLAVLPDRVADAAPFSPAYWAVRGLHEALAGEGRGVAESCAVLLVMAAGCGGLAALRLGRTNGTAPTF